jgi:hypothetical protein
MLSEGERNLWIEPYIRNTLPVDWTVYQEHFTPYIGNNYPTPPRTGWAFAEPLKRARVLKRIYKDFL